MKGKTRSFLRGLAGAASGFALGLVLVRLTGQPAESGAGQESVGKTGTAAPSATAADLPKPGAWQAMDAKTKLASSLGMRGASPEQRNALLQECLRRVEPERSALLAILLAGWAETEPAAAMEWTMAHLEGEPADNILRDLVDTWATRDGQALAEWANTYKRWMRDGHPFLLIFRVLNSLALHDPVAYANFLEMESNKDSVTAGRNFENSLRTEEAVKSMAAGLTGHVAYADNPTEFQRALNQQSTARHAERAKSGWNELFENTAVAWHRMHPAECDAWLSAWPENAQAAARYFIRKAEFAGIVEEAGAAPTPPEIRSLPRPDSAAPSPESLADQVGRWCRWWQEEPAAAEAFLNNALWPDGLKFRARAEGYASAP